MKANLILTDSYFNIFPLLIENLRGKANDLTHKNLVFCEEKLSLMAERMLAAAFGGTFNTEVYSFGNFLRAKKPAVNLLSKEGSAMAVKKILSEIPLKCFNKGKINLAPALFELISQLKSAKVSAEDLTVAADKASGILAAKLKDIAAVYSEYEKFLAANGFADQSSALSFLPEVVENDQSVDRANVYIVGFSGFTVQIRRVIAALFSRAENVTAILTYGDNKFAFVNETAENFRTLCRENNVSLSERTITSRYSSGGKIIKDGLFNPLYSSAKNAERPKARFLAARTVNAEMERIAEIIKNKVYKGECRYRDCAVILPMDGEYKEALKRGFSRLNVPYFLDDKKKPDNFPLVSLIYAYCDVFLRGFKIPALAAFFKNPYIPYEREFKDRFENYLYKYDLSYGKFKKPFIFDAGSEEERLRFEEFRVFIAQFFDKFDVQKLFIKLDVDGKTQEISDLILSFGENEDAAINGQVLDKVKGIIAEINSLLPDAKSNPLDFKNVFTGGVAAMEVSVIPQYNDAVFVGSYKQTAIARSKYLFAVGLTSAVPSFCEDVALLSDGDIDALAEIKVLLEPKINVVNHRLCEETALGLSAYSDELYLSYPLSDYSGKPTVKSEILAFFEKFFDFKPFPKFDGYMTKAQGMRTFSRDCSRFATLKLSDFSYPAGFYAATDGAPEKIVNYANKEIKVNLDNKKSVLGGGVFSPTEIEDYYACPYRSFLIHTLKVKERETGKVNALSVGNLMHEIFKNFISEVDKVVDDKTFDEIFIKSSVPVLNDKNFSHFDGEESIFNVNIALKECKKYCRKLSDWYKKSMFKLKNAEVVFGDGADAKNGYPAVELLNGKVKLFGKIDRVDEYKDYVRIIDYKTGGKEVKDDKIFVGVKLQLYLYSLAIKDKILAGAYYLRVNDEYKTTEDKDKPLLEGKTANVDEIVSAGEEAFIPLGGKDNAVEVSKIAAVQKYVKALAEQAAKQMEDGVIVPSPFEGTCNICQFSPICKLRLKERKAFSVDTEYLAASAECAESRDENKDGAL